MARQAEEYAGPEGNHLRPYDKGGQQDSAGHQKKGNMMPHNVPAGRGALNSPKPPHPQIRPELWEWLVEWMVLSSQVPEPPPCP